MAESFWYPATPPFYNYYSGSYCCGLEFSVPAGPQNSGTVNSLGFFKHAADTVTARNLYLWQKTGAGTGTLLVTVPTSGEPTGTAQWIMQAISPNPYVLTPGVTYCVGYDSTAYYELTSTAIPFTNGHLTVSGSGTNPTLGHYAVLNVDAATEVADIIWSSTYIAPTTRIQTAFRTLFIDPSDPRQFMSWLASHQIDHKRIGAAALTAYPKARIPGYDLQTFGPRWGGDHNVIHQALHALTGTGAMTDLSNVDPLDPRSWQQFEIDNMDAHQQLWHALGLDRGQ